MVGGPCVPPRWLRHGAYMQCFIFNDVFAGQHVLALTNRHFCLLKIKMYVSLCKKSFSFSFLSDHHAFSLNSK